jgi:hypothetical protein
MRGLCHCMATAESTVWGVPSHAFTIARGVQVWYCSADCQRVHWKEGGHKKSCKELQQAAPTKVGATRASTTKQAATTFREAVKISERGRNPWAASPVPPNTGNGGSCIICLESSPPAIQSGCGCRGDAGLAHIKCRVQAAEHKQKSTGDLSGWEACSTCGISFTAPMSLGLAEELYRRTKGRPEKVNEWKAATMIFSNALLTVTK